MWKLFILYICMQHIDDHIMIIISIQKHILKHYDTKPSPGNVNCNNENR